MEKIFDVCYDLNKLKEELYKEFKEFLNRKNVIYRNIRKRHI